MNIEELQAKRAHLRDFTTASRTAPELHGLPDAAYVTPIEAALLLRMSVEALMANRQRRRPPCGFRIGRVVRFTMGEIRSAGGVLRKEQDAA